MDFLDQKLSNYIDQHSQEETPLLKSLSRETHLKALLPQMLSGHPQGLFLSMISKMIKPKFILEVGTYTGYSAICLAQGLIKGGHLHTIDINEELHSLCLNYFKESGLDQSITQHIGDAKNIIPKLDMSFDLIFIDADKQNYAVYFDLIIDKLNSGAIILVDNVLWSGKILNDKKDKDTQAIHDFNRKVHLDSRVENLILPIRDGISILRVK